MTKSLLSALAAFGLLASTASAEDASEILQKSAAALGAGKLTSIEYSGSGKAASLGQSLTPQAAWPTLNVTSYTRTIDYPTQCSREEMVRTLETPPAPGGGAPFQGEQHQVNLVCGPYAWNQPGKTPVPAPGTIAERQLQILSTPAGFVKQAMISNATAKKVKGGNEITISAVGKYKVVGTIENNGLVSKVETWIPSPVTGDMLVETTFEGYKDYGGVKFPSHIEQKQGGYMVLDLNIDKVQPNPANAASMEAPDSVKQAAPPKVTVASQKLADGVWFLGGGTHNSVLIEYKDFLAVVEAPNNEQRSLAVIAEAKRLVPGKPIRYLINTHHHWDHSGGIRTYVAEGATIITSEPNKAYYEEAWKQPRTLEPDMLSENPKKPTFITVKDMYALTDGDRTLDLYLTQGDTHNAYILFGYLPKEKILIEADDFTPPAPGVALVPLATKFGNNLYDNIQRLKLDITTIAPLHGNVAPYSAMVKALGKG